MLVSCTLSLCWSCSKAGISSLLHWLCSILCATETLDTGKIIQTLLKGSYKSWNTLYAHFSNLLSLSWEDLEVLYNSLGHPPVHISHSSRRHPSSALQPVHRDPGFYMKHNRPSTDPTHSISPPHRSISIPKHCLGGQELSTAGLSRCQGQPEVFPGPWALWTHQNSGAACANQVSQGPYSSWRHHKQLRHVLLPKKSWKEIWQLLREPFSSAPSPFT